MNLIQDYPELLDQILNLLELHLGSRSEVVLHDLTKDYSQTISDIRNGHITNRKVGGCGSNLGLEVLTGNVKNGDRFNYVTHTPTGRILRSSSIYLKNENEEPIGSICINTDITETVQCEAVLKSLNNYEVLQDEVFAQDVTALLDFLITSGKKMIGKPIEQMSKDEKIDFIQYLDEKGAFLITRSSEKVLELLGVSRFTFYNYLELSREKKKKQSIPLVPLKPKP